MMRAYQKLSFVFFFFFLFTSLAFASDSSPEGENRVLPVWGRHIQYQRIVTKDPHVSFDGEAYSKIKKGERIYYIVLNTAFFEKQAKKLFQNFSQKQDLAVILAAPLHVLNKLEKNDKDEKALTDLRSSIEQLAWVRLYRSSLAGAPSRAKAEENFVQEFIRIRMKTIEYHEAAHLLDLSEKIDHESKAFAKYTELNAFYAELVHGDNPYDVMFQAVSGFIDEMKQNKNVDYSIEKVRTVLHYLSAHLKDSDKVTQSDLKVAGEVLYRQNKLENFNFLTALR